MRRKIKEKQLGRQIPQTKTRKGKGKRS